jgi:hypothetical protein
MDNAAWFTGGRYGGARSGMGGAAPSALPSWPVVDPYEPGMSRQNWATGSLHNYGNAVMDEPYIRYMNWVTGQRDFRNAERAPVNQAAGFFNAPMSQAPAPSPSTFPRFNNPFMGDDGMRKLLPWERRAVERQMDNIRQNQYGGRFDPPATSNRGLAGRVQDRMGPSPMPRILPRPDLFGRLGRGEFDRFG